MQAIESLVGKVIRETSECTKAIPTSKPRSERDKSAKAWLDRFLRLKTDHHPKLEELESYIFDFCAGVWRNPTQGWLLVLSGFNGSGKTHCAKAVARWIAKVGGGKPFIADKDEQIIKTLSCAYWAWPELMSEFYNGGWDIVRDLFDAPVLIIDELGGGHDPSRAGIDKLCQVLSRREKRWTIVTTNAQPKEWPEVFDRRVASRFLRNSVIVDLSAVPDFATL